MPRCPNCSYKLVFLEKQLRYECAKCKKQLLQDNAKKPEIGKILDEAIDAIESDNNSLTGVLLKNYARPGLNKQKLGELIAKNTVNKYEFREFTVSKLIALLTV